LDVVEQLSDYIDQETRQELRIVIEQHLKNCKDCRFRYDTLRRTIVMYREADPARTREIPIYVSRSLAAALAGEYARPSSPSRAD